jgi:hypothetical protein
MLNVVLLSVTYKPFMLSVFMMSVFILSVFMLSVFMLSVIKLNVEAPFFSSNDFFLKRTGTKTT